MLWRYKTHHYGSKSHAIRTHCPVYLVDMPRSVSVAVPLFVRVEWEWQIDGIYQDYFGFYEWRDIQGDVVGYFSTLVQSFLKIDTLQTACIWNNSSFWYTSSFVCGEYRVIMPLKWFVKFIFILPQLFHIRRFISTTRPRELRYIHDCYMYFISVFSVNWNTLLYTETFAQKYNVTV